MPDLVLSLARVFTLTFVVTSMFSFGLRLTLAQIIQPLRNGRLVLMALLANFVVVPAVALLLARLFGLTDGLRIGLILIGSVAGSALAPKLAEIGRGDIPFAVALTALLVVATVIYLPFTLPLLLPGVQVDTMRIIDSLSLQILLPLILGLAVDSVYEEEAHIILPTIAQISNVSLGLILALMLGGNLGNVIGLLGTGALISILLLLAIAMVTGYFLGGPITGTRRTLALGTGQRNLAAALVVGTGNFADRPEVLAFLAAAGLIGMVIVLPVAGQFRKRSQRTGEPAGEAPSHGVGERREAA